VDINYNQAAFMPQDFATRDFPAQGFAAQDVATQRTAAAGFTMEDMLWAAGIWSVILTLSPVIVFYMLMVA
jgi:hypothetical protein